MKQIYKYPKTYHLQGSRLQFQKRAKAEIPFQAIALRPVVMEEKMDGTNVAISFDDTGKILL